MSNQPFLDSIPARQLAEFHDYVSSTVIERLRSKGYHPDRCSRHIGSKHILMFF